MRLKAIDFAALVGAVAFTAASIGLLYLVFNRWWVALPPWATLALTILLSVAAIGSPIYTLKKMADRALERRLEKPEDGR